MDVIRLRAWMLCSPSAVDHGRQVATDGVRLDVIMVGTWVLCGNGRNLSGRYHGWHMDALWERTEFVWTLRQGRRFRQSKSSKYRKYQGFGGLHARAAAPPRTHERRSVFSCKVHEAPQIPMRSACARRAFTARRYLKQ